MFKKILIANRGEIACRVAATCRRLGVQTVAVYSDADVQARHVKACDEAVAIGAAAAAHSYLNIERLLESARARGAQAIHPGYGFLSENATFAQACKDAGLVFIGPPPSAIEAMGSKSAAKQLMEKAGVPLVPGYHGAHQDSATLQSEATRIGYPVLIKASAGGGGKGMRIVHNAADFAAALASCQREAQASFGHPQVLIEKYLERARHIEVQIFADHLGHCVHLFERDCSAQRRHQKVLEEAPAPGLSETQREDIGRAAVAAARAVGYVGAGTVEFIVESLLEDLAPPRLGQFYFMEMNTRLQVEHPVTEMVTGLDLVEWQLRVAVGEPLPVRQEQLRLRGHALEARLYAENPRQQFLPSIGRLAVCDMPVAQAFSAQHPDEGAAVRLDSGVGAGDAVSSHYDPMIAKLIAWAPNRPSALRAMASALAQVRIVGVHTNTEFLSRLVRLPDFQEARLHTGLIEQQAAALMAEPARPTPALVAMACAAVLRHEREQLRASSLDAANVSSPWHRVEGWRLNASYSRTVRLRHEGEVMSCRIHYATPAGDLDSVSIVVHEQRHLYGGAGADEAQLVDPPPDGAPLRAVVHDGRVHVFAGAAHHVFEWMDPLALQQRHDEASGQLNAPMPGRVVTLLVRVGAVVKKGTPLLIMEAMKMEHTLTAPHDGIVEALPHADGSQVSEGTPLIVLKLPTPAPLREE